MDKLASNSFGTISIDVAHALYTPMGIYDWRLDFIQQLVNQCWLGMSNI
jgi:hypothetical protein